MMRSWKLAFLVFGAVALFAQSAVRAEVGLGEDGYMVYEIRAAGLGTVGRILATSETNVPSELLLQTEYWETDVDDLAGRAITIKLVQAGATSSPSALGKPDEWETSVASDTTASGSLAGGALTWQRVGGDHLPAFRIDPSSSETEWIRPTDGSALLDGASVGDEVQFELVGTGSSFSYTSKRRTVDDWSALPY